MDLAEPGGKGIYLKVGESQKGTVNIILEKVHVSGSAHHGIHISDCALRINVEVAWVAVVMVHQRLYLHIWRM